MARVLVADDDASVRGLITSMLEIDDHQVEAVGTESEAVLLHSSFAPEVLVLDVHMGRGGAKEILRRLDTHEAGVTCPVIVVTGDGEYEHTHPKLSAVLSKPFNLDDLRQAVSSALERP